MAQKDKEKKMECLDEENTEKGFKLDIGETLIRNLLWIPMFIAVMIINLVALSKVEYFSGEGMVGFQLMYLVFCLFFILRLLYWLGHPSICLRRK